MSKPRSGEYISQRLHITDKALTSVASLLALSVLPGCTNQQTGAVVAEVTPTGVSKEATIAVTVSKPMATATVIPPTATLVFSSETVTPVATVTSVATATEVPVTATAVPPTPTEVPTATAVPRVETLPATQKAVSEFVNAMKNAGIAVTPEQVLTGLQTKDIIGKDGNKYQIASTSDGYPLMMRGERGGWRETTISDLAVMRGIKIRALYPWNDEPALNILRNQFNGLILDGGLHWKYLLPEQGKVDYYGPDTIINYAVKNGLPVQGHHLVWGSYDHLPDWLKNGNFSKDELTKLLLKVSGEVVQRYKGKVDVWSVFNEYGYNPSGDFWFQKFGEDFSAFDQVFVQARAIDPNAKLIFGQDGIIPGLSYYDKSREDLFWKFVTHAKDNNIPVDGVGIGGHWNTADFINIETGEIRQDKIDAIRAFVKKAKSMGLDVLQTEGDLRLNTFDSSISMDKRLKYQGMVGEAITRALLSEGVTSIGWFGVLDRNSWFESPEWGGPRYSESNPLLIDDAGNKKAFFFGVLKALIN